MCVSMYMCMCVCVKMSAAVCVRECESVPVCKTRLASPPPGPQEINARATENEGYFSKAPECHLIPVQAPE